MPPTLPHTLVPHSALQLMVAGILHLLPLDILHIVTEFTAITNRNALIDAIILNTIVRVLSTRLAVFVASVARHCRVQLGTAVRLVRKCAQNECMRLRIKYHRLHLSFPLERVSRTLYDMHLRPRMYEVLMAAHEQQNNNIYNTSRRLVKSDIRNNREPTMANMGTLDIYNSNKTAVYVTRFIRACINQSGHNFNSLLQRY